MAGHGHLGVYQEPQDHFSKALSSMLHLPVVVHGVVPPWGQDFAVSFVELHEAYTLK